jgi:uncharacterized protein YndB with AHSA1/START domain
MAQGNSVTAEQAALVLEFDRLFDAPRALVWRMWKDPEHMVRWHGPEGYALLSCDIDFRVGGAWRRCMSNGPGHAHWISGKYLEIDEPSRLSFTYVNEYDGFETVVTMDFVDEHGKTRMYFRQTPFISAEERDGHGWGWKSGFDVFDRYVAEFIDDDWSPKGRPRSDGVAEDIVAARRRALESKREDDNAHPTNDR